MRKTATLTALAVAAGTFGLSTTAAFAAPSGVVGASLTWKVSECAFSGAFVTTANSATDSCKSIRESQPTTGNVSKVTDGWQFSNGTGSYDSATGATTLNFTGTLSLGNTSLGNYYIRLVDPKVVVDNAGNGSLTADVIQKIPSSPDPSDLGRQEIVSLLTVPNSTSWTMTPPWSGVGTPDATAPLDGKEFSPSFVDALDPSLRNWFRASSSSEANANRGEYNSFKAPAPVSIDYSQHTWTPTLQISNADNIQAGETRTIAIHGSGFDPAKQGNGVSGMYVVFGPNPAAITNGYLDPNIFGAAAYLPSGPNSNGEFDTTLAVTGTYADGNGTVWNAANTTLGVSTWAAHAHTTTAWDSFASVAFLPATPAPTPTGPAAKPGKVAAVKVKKIKGNSVTIRWNSPNGATRDAVTGFKVRLSKVNKKKYHGWVVIKGNKVVLKGVKKHGTYRVQVRAINALGVSQIVTLKFHR